MIVGLDIETTGAKPIRERYKTIQIGIAFGTLDTFVSDVGWAATAFEFDPEARKVNKFTDERVRGATWWRYVEESAVNYMAAHGLQLEPNEMQKAHGWKPLRAIAVGWNVGSFDLEYLAKDMPRLAALFSYHSIDLNSICYALGGEQGAHEWKAAAKEHSLCLVGTQQRPRRGMGRRHVTY